MLCRIIVNNCKLSEERGRPPPEAKEDIKQKLFLSVDKFVEHNCTNLQQPVGPHGMTSQSVDSVVILHIRAEDPLPHHVVQHNL